MRGTWTTRCMALALAFALSAAILGVKPGTAAAVDQVLFQSSFASMAGWSEYHYSPDLTGWRLDSGLHASSPYSAGHFGYSSREMSELWTTNWIDLRSVAAAKLDLRTWYALDDNASLSVIIQTDVLDPIWGYEEVQVASYSGATIGFARRVIDISQCVGHRVKIGFLLSSGSTVSDYYRKYGGARVDDVKLLSTFPLSPSRLDWTAVKGGSNPAAKTIKFGADQFWWRSFNDQLAPWVTETQIDRTHCEYAVDIAGLAPGTYRTTMRVEMRRDWSATGAFLPGFPYSFPMSLTIKTVPSVGTPIAPASRYRRKYFTVYGYLKPRHSAGSYPVRIYKYRYVSGAWKSYGYVNAKAYNYSNYTKYLRSISLPYRGRWRLMAYAPADSTHVAKWSSGSDYITVK